MPNDELVSKHYSHGSLLKSIQAALTQLGKTVDSVTIEDIGPVGEFHIGGRLATEHFLDQLNFSKQTHILDVGCGLGGAARFGVSRYSYRVTGIDLTQEFVDTGNVLSTWVKLDKQITLQQGSALSMPFLDEAFDGGYMMHVGMNIDDKTRLFHEIYRVLRSGASFGVYDVMRIQNGELTYPLPWAAENRTSKLATPKQYKQALRDAGFEVVKENNRRDFGLESLKQVRAKIKANGGPPPLGLHTLMQESTAEIFKNLVENIAENYVAPVEIIVNKI